jgi:hypothetical protein
VVRFLVWAISAALRSKALLAVENLCLRQQLLVLQRWHPQPRVRNADRQFWICASRWFGGWRNSLLIAKPETVLRWHRRAWRAYRSWRSNWLPVSSSQSQAEQPLTVVTDTAYGAMMLVCVIASAGFVFTVLVSYPGYLTADATYVYGNVQSGFLGDWQSPLMTIVWSFIDPISPGSGSMFLLIATLYWAGFAILALAVARLSTGLAVAVPLLAFAPPAFMLLAMIWRDIFFGTVWLLAATIIYFVADRSQPRRWMLQGLALVLVGFGVLLRPNAIVAAPLLVAYVAWPERFEWKRTALLFIPALLAAYGIIQIVYYEIFAVHRENPLHSLVVFDLGGITHFTRENQFPVSWSADENALLITRCYEPARWDTYWTWDPCNFVMSRLQSKEDVIFGTSRLTQSWLRAVGAHPVAYLTHRLTFLSAFLAKSNPTIELENLVLRDEIPLVRNRSFVALMALYDMLKRTVLFWPGLWLIFAAAVGALAWRGRGTPSGAFAISVAASGIIYILSFGVFGVAADFRYAYWCVLSSLAGLIPALIAWREERSKTRTVKIPNRRSARFNIYPKNCLL